LLFCLPHTEAKGRNRANNIFQISSSLVVSSHTLIVFEGNALGDLLAYDPVTKAWTDLTTTASGTAPSKRGYHGFTAAGGRLYVQGGWDWLGNEKKNKIVWFCKSNFTLDRLVFCPVIEYISNS
jgi:hypothetical protein